MFIEFVILNPFVMVAFFVAVIALILSMCGFIGNINVSSDGGNVNISGMNAEFELSDEKTENHSAENITKIEVFNPVGELNVKISADNSITLLKKLYLPKSLEDEEKESLIMLFERDFISVNADVISIVVPKLLIKGFMSARVDLEITAPACVSLQKSSGVNDVIVDGRNGDVELENNSGNITLNNISGAVKAATNSGNITGCSLKAVQSLLVNAGDIDVKAIGLNNSSSKIHSNAGNVHVELVYLDDPVNCEISSNTSDVNLTLARNLAVTVNGRTNMGQLELDSAIQIVSSNKTFMGGSVSGCLNNGTSSISLSSNTGSVRVMLK